LHAIAPKVVGAGKASAQCLPVGCDFAFIRIYQPSAHYAIAARSEYLSDRGGMFSNATQALKEATGAYRYNFGDGFSAFLEYRRDWSNQFYFITANPAAPSSHQDTAGVGMVWWYGGKQGAW